MPTTRHTHHVRLTHLAVALLTAAAALTITVNGTDNTVNAQSGDTWLDTLNSYRYTSGLQTVTADPALNAGATQHACYMQQNTTITHNQDPNLPGYTTAGAQAGRNSVLGATPIQETAVTQRTAVERLLSAPVHAMTMLSPYTSKVGYGNCNGLGGQLTETYAIDVTSNVDHTVAAPTTPITFPANGTSIRMNTYGGETPELIAACNTTFRTKTFDTLGIPAWTILPQPINGPVTATWTQPDGTPMPVCVVTETNAPTDAKPYIGNRGIVIFALNNQTPGAHRITINAGNQNVTWNYTTNPDAPLNTWTPRNNSGTAATTSTWAGTTTSTVGTPSGLDPITPFRFADSRHALRINRLATQTPTRIQISGQAGLPNDITALSANITAVNADGPGFLTTYNCSNTVPNVSTLNYGPGEAVGNQSVTPLDANGGLCLYAHAATDVIIDINGLFRAAGTQRFNPVTPARILDTRRTTKIGAGQTLRINTAQPGTGVPNTAQAVALSIAATQPEQAGFIRITPCDNQSGVSNLNFQPDQTIANSVIVKTAAGGDICIGAHVTTHVIIDINGYFTPDGYRYQPLQPTRVFDTRQNLWAGDPRFVNQAWYPWKLAGTGGIPTQARAVSVNITAANPATPGFLTGWDCGPRQETSNVNYTPERPATGNGAMLKLSTSGELCLYAHTATHVIVDINGIWL